MADAAQVGPAHWFVSNKLGDDMIGEWGTVAKWADLFEMNFVVNFHENLEGMTFGMGIQNLQKRNVFDDF